MIVATPRVVGGAPYAATAIPGTTEVLLTTSIREQLLRIDATAPSAPPERLPLPGGAFLLSVAVTEGATHALVPHLQSHTLDVIDLRTMTLDHTLTWQTAPGPTYIGVTPHPSNPLKCYGF